MSTAELIDRYKAYREGKLILSAEEALTLEMELTDRARYLPPQQALDLLKLLMKSRPGNGR